MIHRRDECSFLNQFTMTSTSAKEPESRKCKRTDNSEYDCRDSSRRDGNRSMVCPRSIAANGNGNRTFTRHKGSRSR